MSEKILNGRMVADKIESDLKAEIETLTDKNSQAPGLITILVGDDPASELYVGLKKKASERVGIQSQILKLPASTTEAELLVKIDDLNHNDTIHGILVQLPLPSHINNRVVFSKIALNKDVDCFNPYNFGKLLIGEEHLVPCTPKGIITLMEHYDLPIYGQHAVIVNRSTLIGKPLCFLLLNRHATVTFCHTKTRDLKGMTTQADILILGTGKGKLFKRDMVKEGAVIIDAGTSRVNGKLSGDADFDDVIDKVKAITPVPGGVGPMTIASLLQNTLICYKTILSQ
ncbi:MAG: bifunctional 5,10-methylenetetrahydrofolate dehydrogenase/5,10-methenyltetrahydrofolate cyclohydrolase [Candidatus Helarchaeota archaeon]